MFYFQSKHCLLGKIWSMTGFPCKADYKDVKGDCRASNTLVVLIVPKRLKSQARSD